MAKGSTLKPASAGRALVARLEPVAPSPRAAQPPRVVQRQRAESGPVAPLLLAAEPLPAAQSLRAAPLLWVDPLLLAAWSLQVELVL
jgi:hypothetical protein